MSKSITQSYRFPIQDEQAEEIRRLKDELFMARQEILYLAPDEFHDLLRSYRFCETRAATYAWADRVADQIVERAVPLQGYMTEIFGTRALCPLCRGGTQSQYEQGYSLPVGLHRHLVGYGRVNECPVIDAARELARDAWKSMFAEAEAVAEAQALKTKQARMEVEALYVVGLNAEPELYDHGYGHDARPQDDTQFSLSWAERRLAALGFELKIEDRKHSYTKSVSHALGEFIVFADPRHLGSIQFRVFEAESSPRKRKRARLHSNSFNIRDSYKNHLPEKVAAGVDLVIQALKS